MEGTWEGTNSVNLGDGCQKNDRGLYFMSTFPEAKRRVCQGGKEKFKDDQRSLVLKTKKP